MNVKIYQINDNEERHNIIFMGYNHVKNIIGDIKQNLQKFYKMVYEYDESEIDNDDDVYVSLEKLFFMFNNNHPKDFKGHSLSVSDIIEINNELYFCDSFGWEKIN